MNFKRRAFSLIEVIVVIAIISLLVAMGISSFGGGLNSYRLAIGADAIAGGMDSARLLATSKNNPVQFRVIRPANDTHRYFQMFIENEKGGDPTAYGNAIQLPEGIRLLTDATHAGMLTLPEQPISTGRFAGASYAGIRFNPGGGVRAMLSATTSVLVSSSNNFLTLAVNGASDSLPANWIALRVDGKTGAVSRFQP